MSWDAYCNLPHATSACIAGIDGTQWGKKGNWEFKAGEGAKLAKASVGSMVAIGGTKYMIVNKTGEKSDVLFGIKGETALVIYPLKKCFLAAIAQKGHQSKLIDQIQKFAGSLAQGGY